VDFQQFQIARSTLTAAIQASAVLAKFVSRFDMLRRFRTTTTSGQPSAEAYKDEQSKYYYPRKNDSVTLPILQNLVSFKLDLQRVRIFRRIV
tara:strand:- start:52834 stop:53109 length:276 start_codon:yes stop_codon:yes gene_type:complete